MLCHGDEMYGIGTIQKLYAQSVTGLRFVCLGRGRMFDWLRQNGHRVDLAEGLARFTARGSLTTLMRFPQAVAQARRDAKRIDQLLRPDGVKIIHAHWLPQQLVAGWLRKLGYRSVWQINNNMNPRRLFGLGRTLNHCLARWGADLLLPASDDVARNWRGCGVPIRTIHNAATLEYDCANQPSPGPISCLIAGRITPSKGQHLAVEAVLAARRVGLDVRLDIYGGPLDQNPYADQLRETIGRADARQSIRFMGFCRDLRQRHQDYHLGLQCRVDPEPCSLWVCETLMDGLPLVASATGGTPELVQHGVTGLLFRSNDARDLTDKLIELVKAPSRLVAMRESAFLRGRAHFTVERFVRQTFDAYELLNP